MTKEKKYLRAIQKAFNLLRGDQMYGALALFPAAAEESEELIVAAENTLREALGDDLPKPVPEPESVSMHRRVAREAATKIREFRRRNP
jgi:hypothetical protein